MKIQDFKWRIYACLLLLVGAMSCSKEDLLTYEDVDRIYFRYADEDPTGNPDNQKIINLGYDIPLKDDSIVSIPIKLMGIVAKVDRAVKVDLMSEESSAVEGVDFDFISACLPADSIYGEVKLKLKRTERIAAETLLARIRLVSNENFHTDYSSLIVNGENDRNGLIYNLFFTSLADRPSLWSASMSSMMLQSYFGPYSNEKVVVICEACGVTRDFFEIDPADNDPTGRETVDKRIPGNMAYGMISQVNRYLKRWKDEHNGQARLDENGQEITTGNNSYLE